jgi:programmed cell death protein 5
MVMTEEEQQEKMRKSIIQKVLDKSALERLGRIRLVKPEMAKQLEIFLVQAYQSGELKDVITEQQLITILDQVSTKRDFRIIR